MFELGFLTRIQQRIMVAEQKLWQEMERETLQEECGEVEDWVLDPGNNEGRLSLYERTVALFQVMKNMMGHSRWERQEKNEGEEHEGQWRKEMHAEFKALNLKMDSILQTWENFINCLMGKI